MPLMVNDWVNNNQASGVKTVNRRRLRLKTVIQLI